MKTTHLHLVPRWHYTSTLPISLHGVNRESFAYVTWCVTFYFVNFGAGGKKKRRMMGQSGTSWNTRDQCLLHPMRGYLLPSSSFMMVCAFCIVVLPHSYCVVIVLESTTSIHIVCWCITWSSGKNFHSSSFPSDVIYVMRLVWND